jgi:hypothetical protein
VAEGDAQAPAATRGNPKANPTEHLNLQAGERVEIKSVTEIVRTLDAGGGNRACYSTTGRARRNIQGAKSKSFLTGHAAFR